MSLSALQMSEDVWLTCLTHALTTESEEIMGLLLGDIEYLRNGSTIAHVWGAAPQTRSDRRKDRVETNPEQLAAASALAERMTITTGRTTRVIGWYHSHPHITVLPSHVDVHTQAMYQLLDPGFIGVIFSCFSEDAHKVGRIQVMAFQSFAMKQKQPVQVPFHIADNTKAKSPVQADIIDIDSGDSHKFQRGDNVQTPIESFFDRVDLQSPDRRDMGGGSSSTYLNDNSRVSAIDVESVDSTYRIQEAMHRSNMDCRGAEYVRKEIPLQIVKVHREANSFSNPYVDLQKVLLTEEQGAYTLAMSQSIQNGRVHPLVAIHHTSTYQASMCKLMEYCLAPVISSLLDRIEENKVKLSVLKEEEQCLLNLISKENQSSQSPRRQLNRAMQSGMSERKPIVDPQSNPRSFSEMSPKKSFNR